MSWQFTMIDYTGNSNGVSTPITEPVGWDGINLHLKRDEHWHGFFSYVDDSFGGLQFDGAGAAILRNAYYNFGINADVRLSIAYSCGDDDANPLNLYIGSFYFSSFKDYLADRCYVECSLEANKDFMNFKNRVDQQVDLDSLASFDQLPQPTTLTGVNSFFTSVTNSIRVQALLNGVQPGSLITIAGSASNNRNFTVASAKIDYSNVSLTTHSAGVQYNNTTMGPVSGEFNPITQTISVNVLIDIQLNTVINVTGAANAGNNQTFKVLAVTPYFNYTSLKVVATAISPPAMVPETAPTLNIQGTFIQSGQPTSTIINVVETVVPENGGAAVIVNVSGIWVANNMVAYNGLNQIITIPSKAIRATSKWQSSIDTAYDLDMNYSTTHKHNHPLEDYHAASVYFTPDWLNVVSDIDETDVSGASTPGELDNNNNAPETLVLFKQTALPCAAKATVTVNVSGYLYPNLTRGGNQSDYVGGNGSSFLAFNLQGMVANTYNRDTNTDESYYDNITANRVPNPPANGPTDPGTIFFGDMRPPGNYTPMTSPLPMNYEYITPLNPANVTSNSNDPLYNKTPQRFAYSAQVVVPSFQPGDYLWIFFCLYVNNGVKRHLNFVSQCYPDIYFDNSSFFQIDLDSTCEDTPCNVYLINEVMSRCIESYTNGNLRVYSNYFGRSNSQPYTTDTGQTGCGGLEAITNGLRIRGCMMPDGSTIPKFTTSMKDVFDSLDAIHNIGMCLEADTNRSGYNRIRVEPYDFFFNNNVLLTCSNVMKYSREVQPSLITSSLKVGYQQFETWNNNGLYDIFGHRTYRTELTDQANTIDKTCKWMASDYAIEFTRRQYGASNADSRYDSNIFILCLKDTYQGQSDLIYPNSFLIYDPNFNLAAGHSITITGTSFNNFTNTINAVNQTYFGNGIVQVHMNGNINNETAASATVQINGGYTFNTTPVVFVGPNAAFMLDTVPIYSAQPGDSFTFTGTGQGSHHSAFNGTYTIDSLGGNTSAISADNTTVNLFFPQIIFPTTPLVVPPPGVNGYNGFWGEPCVIVDAANPFYTAEQGIPGGSANIINPDTVMNYRISPAHNAMRHYKNAAMAYRFPNLNAYNNTNLQFTEGNGNFYAIGGINNSCSPEAGLISEGGKLSPGNFAAPADANPLFYPEIIKFEYPLTWAQFVAIQANPYGLVEFFHATEGTQQGWISELQYKPYTGMAEFTLYPKIPN